jgi:hypothetical protein
MVTTRAGRTLDQFAVDLQQLHESLVERNLLEGGEIVQGQVNQENASEEVDARSEAERLRLQLAEQAMARVNIAPLPAAFLRLNINATAARLNTVTLNSANSSGTRPVVAPSSTGVTLRSSNSIDSQVDDMIE